MTTLHGIDVSHWQAGLKLAQTDAQFVVMKATESTNYVDPSCNGFYNQAKKAGIPRGVYHFYQGDPVGEADHFLRNISGYLGDAILVLDFETHTSDIAGARDWLDRVRAKTGISPLIYMSQSVAANHNWTSVAKEYGLWVARYNDTIGYTGAWTKVAMWQYTNAHHTGGMAVDGDYFYGNRAAWDAYATGTTPHPDDTTDHHTDPTPDNGGTMNDARMVWDEDLALWTPKDGTAKDPMPAGQQLNQARGYAEDTFENSKQIKKALRALAKDPHLAGGTRDQMLEVLASD